MNTGPYSEPAVAAFLNAQFHPVRTECFWDHPTEPMGHFGIQWTPTFLVHDPDGKEHHRFVGYVPTDDLLAHLWLGKAKIPYDSGRHDEAIPLFETVLARHPAAGAAPEAAFLRGVAGYKSTRDAKELRRAYDLLSARYPQSEWARRAEPYSAIPL
jgi:tetratricopeptide (TPR) repeat protein